MDWLSWISLESWQHLLQQPLYGNGLLNWLSALGITLIAYITLSLSKMIIGGRVLAMGDLTHSEPIRFTGKLIKNTHPLTLLALSLFIGSHLLELPAGVERLFRAIPALTLLFQLACWGNGFIEFLQNQYIDQKENEQERLVMKTMLGPIRFVVLLTLWSVLLLAGLSNLGINITALIAGMGVGGIAIALAVQNILGDLFASMSIVIDKPFVIGDFIIVDNMLGTVEYIGLKTTRVRGLGGEQLIFSNSDLLGSRIRNFKHMEERRIVFHFRVIYQTPIEQVAQIPGLVSDIIGKIPQARLDRAHFKGFGESSLEFEVVYHVLDPAYAVYMDVQQEINLALMKRFRELDIKFALPARTLYVTNKAAPLKVHQTHEVDEDALKSPAC